MYLKRPSEMESSGHLDRESKTNTKLGIPGSGLDPGSASYQLYDFRPPPRPSEPLSSSVRWVTMQGLLLGINEGHDGESTCHIT